MQLLADTSGLRVSVPDSSQIPARGAALFGAVAAGRVRRTSRARSPRPGRGSRAATSPTPDAKAVYDRVYAIYRSLYERLGRTRSRSAPRPEAHLHRKESVVKPRIGLLGIMQELYDAMLPGDHRAPGRVRARASRRGSPDVADVEFIAPGAQPRGRRGDRARVRRARARRDRDRDAHLRPGDAHRARAARDAAAAAARQHPARARGHGRVGHGRPDLQPGDPRRPGPGQRARARRGPVLGDHRRMGLGRVRRASSATGRAPRRR